MIKVIFTDGSEMTFHGTEAKHDPNYRRFLITQPGSKYTTIILDSNVKACGVWDKEKNEFA